MTTFLSATAGGRGGRGGRLGCGRDGGGVLRLLLPDLVLLLLVAPNLALRVPAKFRRREGHPTDRTSGDPALPTQCQGPKSTLIAL